MLTTRHNNKFQQGTAMNALPSTRANFCADDPGDTDLRILREDTDPEKLISQIKQAQRATAPAGDKAA